MVIRLSVGDFAVCGRRERVAPPLRGAKRIDNLRFSILLGLQLSLICQSGADHRPASASKSGNDSRVTLVFILRDIRSSQITFCCTYGLLTLCRTLRRAADLCSSPISGTAKRLRKTRKKNPLPFLCESQLCKFRRAIPKGNGIHKGGNLGVHPYALRCGHGAPVG